MVPRGSLLSRRVFLASAVALATARMEGRQAGTRLILLGTGGGPRPRTANSASAQLIVSNGIAYVVDCGDGVARQIVWAGVPLPSVRHIFITHQHSDHTADYGNLILLAWTAGLSGRVDAWGPPPLERMTQLFFDMNASDINTRIANEGRVPLTPLVHVHELRAGRVVLDDDNVKVTSTLVDHPLVGHPGSRPARDLRRILNRGSAPDSTSRYAAGC
jgi:ribonuclease BN (tRNA processing enzyme)